MFLVQVPTMLNFLMTELLDVMLIVYVSATHKIGVPILPQMTLPAISAIIPPADNVVPSVPLRRSTRTSRPPNRLTYS